MFKQHLEMIGRNESPTKKAKFWQSYVRSLKGSEDIRAHDTPKVRAYRPFSSAFESLPPLRSIYDDAGAPSERIQSSGYRYLPVHRETYGYSPRAIYDHHYSRTIPANYDVERAWNEHLKRMQEIERRYPSRYGLYLKDKPSASVPLLEYEPEDKPDRFSRSPSVLPIYRAGSVPRGLSVPPSRCDRARTPACDPLQPVAPFRAGSAAPFRAGSVAPRASSVPRYSDRELSPFIRSLSPLRASSYDPYIDAINRMPLFHPRNRYRDIFNPRPSLPFSAITRDPFWWDIADLAPFRPSLNFLPSSLVRDSFLSPVKRRYLWTRHPIRPFAHN